MKSKEFRNLVQTANSITTRKAKSNLNESATPVAQNIYEGFSQEEVNLVETISEVLEQVEKDLNITLTKDEINESTAFILETSKNQLIIEEVEKEVGFELNEEEVNYVLNQIRG